ncbi:MAG: SpoIIIAH-like family protein [Clostridiales bacterium]|nr:SpoIIIAH-like family protein [Clostridiales bacterium]
MIGNREKTERRLRLAGCAALLAILAASSYAGAGQRQTQAVSVPVMVEMISHEAIAAASAEETGARFAAQRDDALALLQNVLDDPKADEDTVKKALEEKIRIAQRMETEASVSALLAQMGFENTTVAMGEGALSIVAPWQIAENEQNRMRMIDAAASRSGLSAECIKIILAKK